MQDMAMACGLIERSRQGVDVFQRPVDDKLNEKMMILRWRKRGHNLV
jgi:hypothetical protein